MSFRRHKVCTRCVCKTTRHVYQLHHDSVTAEVMANSLAWQGTLDVSFIVWMCAVQLLAVLKRRSVLSVLKQDREDFQKAIPVLLLGSL